MAVQVVDDRPNLVPAALPDGRDLLQHHLHRGVLQEDVVNILDVIIVQAALQHLEVLERVVPLAGRVAQHVLGQRQRATER